MQNVLVPNKKYEGIDKLQLAKEHLIEFSKVGQLFVFLNKKEYSLIESSLVNRTNPQKNIFSINSSDFFSILFDSEKYGFIKDIKIFGIFSSHMDNYYEIEEKISEKKFHSAKNIVNHVDLYFYSENFFETLSLFG